MIQECFFTCDSNRVFGGWRGRKSGGPGGVQLLPLFSTVEFANHPGNVNLGLPIRRYAVVLVDRGRPGVIGSQGQGQMIVIPQEQSIQIGRTTINVLLRAEAVGHA